MPTVHIVEILKSENLVVSFKIKTQEVILTHLFFHGCVGRITSGREVFLSAGAEILSVHFPDSVDGVPLNANERHVIVQLVEVKYAVFRVSIPNVEWVMRRHRRVVVQLDHWHENVVLDFQIVDSAQFGLEHVGQDSILNLIVITTHHLGNQNYGVGNLKYYKCK